MNTDTRILRPAELASRLERHRNTGSHYAPRHDADNPPKLRAPLPQHVRTQVIERVPSEVGTETRRIDVGQARVQVPVPPRTPVVEEVPAAAVPAPPIELTAEPLAPVTAGVLMRIWMKLRAMQ
jgi:hypothetical protein